MRKNRRVKNTAFVIAVFLISFAAFALFNQLPPTGFTVAQAVNPIVSMNLSKSEYTAGEGITGTVKVVMGGFVDPEQKLIIEVGGFESEKNITALLRALNRTYQFSERETVTSNPQPSKSLSINVNLPPVIALYLPKTASLEPVRFNFEAATGSSLQFPKIDIGDDGFVEWEYVGERIGWGATVLPEGAQQPQTSIVGEIRDSNSMYCEILNFPKAPDFYLGAQYKRVNKSGNIKIAILGIDPTSGEGPGSISISPIGLSSAGGLAYTCDLPEEDTTKWNYCSIKLPSNLRGNNLICVYSSTAPQQEVKLYEIPLESVGSISQTSYFCDMDGVSCSLIGEPQKFYVRLQAGVYEGQLNSTTVLNFSAHYTVPPVDGVDYITSEIQSYLFSKCTPDSVGKCVVPIAFPAESSGSALVSNLVLAYTTAFRQTETNFYDLAKNPPLIKKIGTIDLSTTNFTLVFNLNVLGNITAPAVTASSVKTIKVSIGSSEDLKTFLVNPSGYVPSAAGITEVENMIKETKTILEALKNNPTPEQAKIIDIEGLSSAINNGLSNLATYENTVNSIKQGIGQVDVTSLKAEVESFRSGLVKDIEIESGLTDIVLVEPDDITNEIVPAEKHDVTALLQDKVEVKTTVSKYSVELFDGTAERGNLVELAITPKGNLAGIDVFVVITKNAVENVQKLKFKKSPDKIVNPDPIVKWFYKNMNQGSKNEISFVAETGFDLKPNDIKVIIAETIEKEEECVTDKDCKNGEKCKGGQCVKEGEELSKCGDGICTTPLEDEIICPEDCKAKLPWITIVIIVVVTLLGGLYINLYRGKGNFRELTRGKNPFKTEEDLFAVMGYIKSALEKGQKTEETGKSLMEKGWTDKQVNFAFEELHWTKNLEEKTKTVPMKGVDLAPMKEYVEKAILKGIKRGVIIDNLTTNGWEPAKVKLVYIKTKMKLAARLLLKKITFSKKTYK